MLRLARSVSLAIVHCVRSEKKNTSVSKTGKKKKKKATSEAVPTLFIAEKELARIKNYLVNARPKQSKQNLFHEVLKVLTKLMMEPLNVGKSGKIGNKFLERIDDFRKGLGHTLDIFLASDIKSVDLTNVQHLFMNWVDSCRLSNIDPALGSVMNHGQVEKAMLRIISERSKNLMQIEELIWPHLVSGELLRIVGGHCHSLQTLVLSCECQVAGRDEDESTFTLLSSDTSWEDDIVKSLECLHGRSPGHFVGSSSIKGCPNLKKLVLPHIEDEKGTAVAVMADTLTALTNLEYISGLPILSILMRYKSKPNAQSKLKLKNICDHDLYMRRPQPNESYLSKLLPNLDMIDIIASAEVTKRLSHSFSNITTLKCDWPDFEEYTKSFPNLKKLDLIMDYKGVWQLLRNIGKGCKKIESITLRQPTMVVSADHEHGVPPPRIPSLEHFQLIRSSFIEFTAFRNFVMGSPNIKKLQITLTNDRNYVVDEFDDRLIRSVTPYLKHLEHFSVESLYRYNLCMHLNCTLSLDTVKELIDKCKNISYSMV